MLVFDEQEYGLPVAWVLAHCNRTEDIEEWLQILHNRGKELRGDWKVNAFMTDDSIAEIEAIRYTCMFLGYNSMLIIFLCIF